MTTTDWLLWGLAGLTAMAITALLVGAGFAVAGLIDWVLERLSDE